MRLSMMIRCGIDNPFRMTQKHHRIEIPLSKKKLFLLLIGAIVFVALGTWFVMSPETFSKGPLRSVTAIYLVGMASIVFFGFAALYILRKLPDSKPGLIIDETGITDNSSAIAAGHIPWTDIDSLSVITIQKQSFILFNVHHPQDYIDRQKGILKKKMMQMNVRLYGSPLLISASGLKIGFEELYKLVSERMGGK